MKYWLRKRVLTLKLEETTAKLNWYEEQFRLLQQQRFGAKSEKVSPEQLSLFNMQKGPPTKQNRSTLLMKLPIRDVKGKEPRKS